MRPGQNKRMRGRNRRGPNPLTRSFESNGPDVKVRGTAQHIAEKYTQLARDAHLAGDPVTAESHLQHAEHYYRIIAAAFQAQQALQNGTADDRDDDDDDDFDTASDRFTFRSPQTVHQQQQGGQPFIGERVPAEFSENGEPRPEGEEQPGGETREGQPQQHRQDRGQDRNYDRGQDRGQDRGYDNRNQQGNRNFRDDRRGNRFDRNFRRDRNDFGGQDRSGERQERPHQERFNQQDRPNQDRRDSFQPRTPRPEANPEAVEEQPGLPSFLTAPVRPIQIDTSGPDDAEPVNEGGEGGNLRPRRRRRGRPSKPADGMVDLPGGDEG